MKTKEYVKQYDHVSEDVKFISNSLIRLKVLEILYENPKSMKELTDEIKVNYSTVSSTLHSLELKGMIYRKSNRYHLVNYIRLQMDNLLKLAITVNLLDEIFTIVEGHIVESIPRQSILDLYLLQDAELLESDGINVDVITDFIEEKVSDANCTIGILPVYYEGFNQKLNELVERDKFVEIIVSEGIIGVYEEKSEVKYLSSFRKENNFMLIRTNETMIIGFFRNDGNFDKNRILVSSSQNALDWADGLVKNFKKMNK